MELCISGANGNRKVLQSPPVQAVHAGLCWDWCTQSSSQLCKSQLSLLLWDRGCSSQPAALHRGYSMSLTPAGTESRESPCRGSALCTLWYLLAVQLYCSLFGLKFYIVTPGNWVFFINRNSSGFTHPVYQRTQNYRIWCRKWRVGSSSKQTKKTTPKTKPSKTTLFDENSYFPPYSMTMYLSTYVNVY